MTIDYYVILGVEPNATPEAIKKAHRRLARQWHPDINKSPQAQAKFVEAQIAYDVLIDPQKRTTYDSLRNSGRRPTSDHFRSERTTRRSPTVDETLRERATYQQRTSTQTIDDFVADVNRFAGARMTDAAERAYRSAEQFAGRQPDQVTADKLRKMKYSILDEYAAKIQNFAGARMTDAAERAYRSAEQFAGRDEDRGVLTRLENMKKMVRR